MQNNTVSENRVQPNGLSAGFFTGGGGWAGGDPPHFLSAPPLTFFDNFVNLFKKSQF